MTTYVASTQLVNKYDTHKEIETKNENNETVKQRVEGKDGKIDVIEFKSILDTVYKGYSETYTPDESADLYNKWMASCTKDYKDIRDDRTLIEKIHEALNKLVKMATQVFTGKNETKVLDKKLYQEPMMDHIMVKKPDAEIVYKRASRTR